MTHYLKLKILPFSITGNKKNDDNSGDGNNNENNKDNSYIEIILNS